MLFKNRAQLVASGQTPDVQKKRRDMLDIFTDALHAVNPYNAVQRVFSDHQLVFDDTLIDVSNFERIYVVGFGKACVGMAQAVCDRVDVTRGVVITNDPSAVLTNTPVDVVVGGHPIPNKGSFEGAERILEIMEQCDDNDLLLVLISGGGSALLCKPRVSIDDLQETTRLLLRSGADINEMNTVRKHLSHVKGGQLMKHARGVVVSLIISDIVHDPLEFIASGPTVGDSTTFSDARRILRTYQLWDQVPSEVKQIISEGINGVLEETPKPDNPIFHAVHNVIIANNAIACKQAAAKAQSLGYNAQLFSTSLTGEAKTVGRELINKAKTLFTPGNHGMLIAGGETTVTVHGSGKGGRNQELVLGCIEAIAGADMVVGSLATDGVDGVCDAAGAIADGYTLSRAQQKGLHPQRFLDTNNSYEFFTALDDAFLTGPTGTNVMDIQLFMV